MNQPPQPHPITRWLGLLSGLDKGLVTAVGLLLGFGVLMIISASSLSADARYGDGFHFVTRQLTGVALGLGAIVAVLAAPYRLIRLAGWPLYVASLVGLILVFSPIGVTAYAASRWISLGGLNVQPSEFGKVALIMVLAHYLSANEGRLADVVGVVLPALLIPIPMLVLLMAEPDFGTTVVTCGLVGVLLFVAGLQWRYLLTLGGMATLGLGLLAVWAPYRVERLVSFLDPFADPEGSGYQVIQGWIAMAAGGWSGAGIGTGVAQRGGLPEAHNDFISAVIGEELGALGWGLLGVLYLVLVWRGFAIAAASREMYGTLVAAALTTLLASQAVINLGVVVGWMPAKGLVLPFVSYGSSAVLVHLMCVGLLLRVGIASNTKGV